MNIYSDGKKGRGKKQQIIAFSKVVAIHKEQLNSPSHLRFAVSIKPFPNFGMKTKVSALLT